MIVFLLSVCVPTCLCYAEDKEKEEEPKEILLDVESAYEIPHTRSLYSAIPEAVLQGTSVRVTFDEPLPYVDIRVLDAGSAAAAQWSLRRRMPMSPRWNWTCPVIPRVPI